MDFLVDFDGPTSTPASSNHTAFNGGVVSDPFDFDPFSSDPFSTDSYRKQSVDVVANEGRFFDDFDPFGSGLTTASPSSSLSPTTVSTENNLTTPSNLQVANAPAADAVDIFGMTSSVTKNGNGFEVDWTNSNGHVTYGTPNAAFIGNESNINSSPAAPTTQNDGNGPMTSSLDCGWQGEPAQQADWTSDWSNDGISAASGGVEVVGSAAGNGDGHLTGSSNAGYVAQESVIEGSTHELENFGNAVVVNEPSSEPQNVTSSRGGQLQTPTPDSSNGYALTDVIDDMMASEFPEASAPKADIEDELMSPVLPVGSMNGSDVVERQLPTTFNTAPIAVSTSASAADCDESRAEVTSCSTLDTIVDEDALTGHQICRPPVLETQPFNFADSTTAAFRKADVVDGDVFIPHNDITNEQAPVIGDKRLILSGPLQLMGRYELASRPGMSGGGGGMNGDNRQILSPTHVVVDEVNLSISITGDGSTVSADSSTEHSEDQSGIDVWNACLKEAVGSETRQKAEIKTVNGDDILVAKPVINFDLRKNRRECDALSADGSRRIVGDVSRVMIDVQSLQSPSSDNAEIRKRSGTSPEACSIAVLDEGTVWGESKNTDGCGPAEHFSDVFNGKQSDSAANLYNFDDAFSQIQAQLDAAASGTSTINISAAVVDKEPETVAAHSAVVDAASEQHILPVLERAADTVTVQESQNSDRTEQCWQQNVIKEASDNDIDQTVDTKQETTDKAVNWPQEPDTGSPVKQPDTVQSDTKASYYNFEDEFSRIQAQLDAAVSGASSFSASSVTVSAEESVPVKVVADTTDNHASQLPNNDLIAESDRKSREIDQYWRHYERDQIIVSDGEKVDLFDEHPEKITLDQSASTLPVSTDDVTFNKTTPADHETELHQEPQMAAGSPDEGHHGFDSFVDDEVQQSSTTTTVRSVTRADEEDQSRRTSVAISDAGSMTADDDSDRNQQQISLSYGNRNDDVILEDQQRGIFSDMAETSVRTLSNKFDSQETYSQRVADITAPTTQACSNVVSAAADGSTCKKCGKRVYEMEKMVTDQTVYHKTCFRCNHCHRVLSLANFACMEGHIYCKPHFMEIFMTKGSYDDSFVTGKDMTNWNPAEGIDDYRRVPLELDEEFLSSDLENTPSARIMSRSYNEITLVPIQAVRGIYEKLSRDAELAMAAADVSPLKQPQHQQKHDDDTNATTKRHIRRSSVSSTSFKSVEQSVRPTDAAYQEITPCQLPLLNTEHNVQSDLEDAGSESFGDSSSGAVISGSTVGSVVPEELPPPQFTKHLLERFRQLEEAQQQQQLQQQQHQKKVALSRAVSAPNTPLHLSTLPHDYQTQLSLSPTPPSFLGRELSGTSISDSGNDELTANCDKAAAAAVYNAENEIETASAFTEVEQLPLRGQTKALLVQWRSLEVSGSTAPALGRGRSMATTSTSGINASSSYSTRSRSMPRIRDDSVETGRSCSLTSNSDVVGDRMETDDKQSTTSSEVPATASGIRPSDVDNVDNLPPPMMTRYMLAKFQNMSAEAMICSGLQPAQSKKNFKWEVKETAPVGYGADGQHKSSAKSKQPRLSAGNAAEIESHAISQPEVDSETGSRHTSVSELEERKTEGSNMTSTLSTDNLVPSQESIVADDQDFESAAAASVNNRSDELPEPGMARNLLAMFQSMQQQNSHH